MAIAAAAVPPAAGANTIGVYHQVQALVPMRIHEQIGFVPIGGMTETVKIRMGGTVYKGPWANVTASRLSLTQALTEIRRYRNIDYAYGDRALTARERRHFSVLVDLGRDADVLVVKQGHPACAGLTLAQARSIAAGKVTDWSQVVSGFSGPIALRHTVVRGAFERRFDVARKPSIAKGRADGGLKEAATSLDVAAITSWSRARFRGGVCAVPLGGVTPTNVTVHGLSFPGAYPVTFIAAKKRRLNRLTRTQERLYVRFLESDKAAGLFRGNGLLMSAEKPIDSGGGNGGGGSAGGPSQDAQGRAITSTRDDAGTASALTGERLERDGLRWAFEPDSVLHLLESSCAQSTGRWTLIEGWRYSENGGGVIARVRTEFEQASDHTIELPTATPDAGFIDGEQYARSRSLPATC